MSGSANDPARSIERTIPPQPYQILMYDHAFTPYYRTVEEARKYPGPSTPYLHNMLVHPPEEFAVQQRASGEVYSPRSLLLCGVRKLTSVRVDLPYQSIIKKKRGYEP